MTEDPAGIVDAHHHLWDLAVRDQPWTAGLGAARLGVGGRPARPAPGAAGRRAVFAETAVRSYRLAG